VFALLPPVVLSVPRHSGPRPNASIIRRNIAVLRASGGFCQFCQCIARVSRAMRSTPPAPAALDPVEQRRPSSSARRSRMPSIVAQLGPGTRIRSTSRDAALACAVLPEQREPSPVRHEPSTANLGQLTAAHEHARASSRTRAARMGSQSATARVAHRPSTWAPGALRCALFRVPYVRVSPREVPCIRAFTRSLTHFQACSAVSRWGILAVLATFTRTGAHDTAQHSYKLSSPVVGNLGLFWGCEQQSHVARVRRDGRALPGGDP
jgi:hypothetical protein